MRRSMDPTVIQLRQARKELGWSPQDLAIRSGVNPATISKLEAGLNGGHVATVAALADAMGLELRLAPKAKPLDSPAVIAERRRILNEALSDRKGGRR